MLSPLSIGFLGAGQMATALAKGWLNSGLINTEHCAAADVLLSTRERFHAQTQIRTVPKNSEVIAATEIVILAVKPQHLPNLCEEIRGYLTEKHLIISIAAGITLDRLGEMLGRGTRLIRVMPNTPCLVGASAAGFSIGPAATLADSELVLKLFSAVGKAYEVPENLLDAVTGLSGSGPAYVAMFIEALADGGVRCGLSRPIAQSLAIQTVLGTAKLLEETGQHPAVLKDSVASPGGTTIAGIHALEGGAFRGIVMDAVQAASQRATALG